MNIKIIMILLLILIVPVLFIYKAQKSRSNNEGYSANIGLSEDKLKHCGKKPNCVCTEYKADKEHYIVASSYDQDEEDMIEILINEITAMGGEIKVKHTDYIAAEFKSRLFGFVDDFEVRINNIDKKLHIRSASRVGYSDMGANRKRVVKFKERIKSIK